MRLKNGLLALTLWALASTCGAEGIYMLEALATRTKAGHTHLLVKLTDDSFGFPIDGGKRWQSTGLCAPSRYTARFDEYAKYDDDHERDRYVVRLWENEQPQPLVQVHILNAIREHSYVLLSYATPVGAGWLNERQIRIQMGRNGFFNENFRQALGVLADWDTTAFDPQQPWRWLYADADKRLNALYRELMALPPSPNVSPQGLQMAQRLWIKEKEALCDADPLWRCRWYMTAERAEDLKLLLQAKKAGGK